MEDQKRAKILKAINEEYQQYLKELDTLLLSSNNYISKARQAPIILSSQFKIFKLIDKFYPELESIDNFDDCILKLDEIVEFLIPTLQSNKPIGSKERKYLAHTKK